MLTDSEREILTQPGIDGGYKTVAEYRIYLEWFKGYQEVRFRLQVGTDGNIHFVQSHFIKTPVQGGPYRTSRSYEQNVEAALRRAVDTILAYYRQAIDEGHDPANDWFVKNEAF